MGELCKFRIVPVGNVLDLINECLNDFVHHNVDVVCNVLETCGKFLYRNPETAVRTGNLLDKMWRLKSVRIMDARHRTIVETAYFASRPPERQGQKPKSKDPVCEYVKRKILYAELTKTNFDWSLKQMRKLPWSEELEHYVARTVLKSERIRSSSLSYVALLVASISKYREAVGISVLDGLLESIRIGLETNDHRMSQRRVAEIKLLGEFYNCRSIDSTVIFEVLYLLITLGHDPSSDIVAPDPAEDFFRARLVCVLLDTCGQYFQRGLARKRLTVFLRYFDRYLLLKGLHAGYGLNLPLEIQFLLFECVEPYRKSRRPETLDEANEEVTFVETSKNLSALVSVPRFEIKPPLPLEKTLEQSESKDLEKSSDFQMDEVEDALEIDEDQDEDTSDVNSEEEDSSDGEDVDSRDDEDDEDDEDDDGDDDADDDEEDDDEYVDVTLNDASAKPRTEEEEELDRELAQMTAEFMSVSKPSKPINALDRMAMPLGVMGRGIGSSSALGEEEGGLSKSKSASETVAFAVLLRRGGKNQTKELAVPAESAIATAAKESRSTERAEQLELKRLVLSSNTVMNAEANERWNDRGDPN